jgi:hypothetical protein
MPGKPSRARALAKREERLANYVWGFKCKGCGHSEAIHLVFTGRCLHEEMQPKDGSKCDCQKMDELKGENK